MHGYGLILKNCFNMDGDCASNGPNHDEYDGRSVLESMNSFRESEQMCDAVLECDDVRFPVHRVILAGHSEYFRALFTNWNKDAKDGSTFHITDTNAAMLKLLLDYMYTHKTRVDNTNLNEVMRAADIFLISGLVDYCCQYKLQSLTVDNCIETWLFADRMYRLDIIKAARRLVCNNFYALRNHEMFGRLEFNYLHELLSDEHLNVKREEHAWEAALRWIGCDAASRVKHVTALLKCLRLGLMEIQYFEQRVRKHEFVMHELTECGEFLDNAHKLLVQMEELKDAALLNLSHPLITPRVPHDVLFAVGGWSEGSPITYFESYDTRADRWYVQPGLQPQAPRAYHGLVSIGYRIYCVGGYDGHTYYNSMSSFDVVAQEWTERAPMYYRRCYVSVTVCRGHIYALGGYDGRHRMRSAERYDPQHNQWSVITPMKYKRSDSAAVGYRDRVYVIGGFNGESCMDTVEYYDPDSAQWSLVTNMPAPRSGLSAAVYRDHVYVIGGFDGHSRQRSVMRLDRVLDKWEHIPDMFAPRSNFAAAVIDDMLFAIGGFNGRMTVQNVECYDADQDEWFDATDLNLHRSALKAVVITDVPNAITYTFQGQAKPADMDTEDFIIGQPQTN